MAASVAPRSCGFLNHPAGQFSNPKPLPPRHALHYLGGVTLTCIRRQRVSIGAWNGRADLSRRRTSGVSPRHHRSRYRQGHLALARQAHRRHGARRHRRRPRRPDREGRQDRVPDARGPARAGADPPRRRPCDGGGGAVAVARHAGDDRPGDRQRLLLRLLPQRAVHAGRPAGDRKENARDHRARQTLHQGGLAARRGQARVQGEGRELQGRAGRCHSAGQRI